MRGAHHSKAVNVPPWHYLVAMCQPNLELANRHHLVLWIASRLKKTQFSLSTHSHIQLSSVETHLHEAVLSVSTYLVKVSFDYMYVTSNSLEVVVRLFGDEVSGTENVLDLAWYLVCTWEVGRTERIRISASKP